MPNGNYLIQSPKGEKIDPKLAARISDGLTKLGVPPDNWRYVVLPEQNWQDTVDAYGQTMPHHTDTAFSNLPGKVTYLRQSKLNRGDADFMTTLAHEFGHRKLNSTKEDVADRYARQAVAEWQKYGRSNEAAKVELQNQAAKLPGEFEPTHVPPETQLVPPMSPEVQKIMNQQPVRSHAERVMAQQPSSLISMADRMKLQPEE